MYSTKIHSVHWLIMLDPLGHLLFLWLETRERFRRGMLHFTSRKQAC